jgi:hypothetical protein
LPRFTFRAPSPKVDAKATARIVGAARRQWGGVQVGVRACFTATAALALVAGSGAFAQDRPAEVAGHPNLNGVWQAISSAHWNLEAHSAENLPGFPGLGAIGAIPAGLSVVVEGEIPYLPAALEKRDANRAGWPESDPETACYLPGIPRANYMPYPFQIVQGDGDILFSYSYATSNRVVHIEEPQEAPVDAWMGVSNGRWEGDTLVVEVIAVDDRTWLDRAGNHHSNQMVVTERFSLIAADILQYEATIEDPLTFSAPWTISMPLYRQVEPSAELLEFNCIPFAEEFLYGDLEAETADE